MINHYTKPLAPAAGQPYVSLEDFERADVRVAERRFGARDTIFAPGDPDGQLYFLLEGTVRVPCACTRCTANTRKPRSRC
jgi:hypothetical protein